MSISSSLLSALSGLNAASRAVELVSSNVANAMTEGYARREINLASQSLAGNGAGVRVVGITRHADERALADQRQATANLSNATARSDAWSRIAASIGYPTEPGALTARIDAFESALIGAASRPDETQRLESAVAAAASLADGLNRASDGIQQMRMDADSDIAAMVDRLNGQLKQVQALNWQIFRSGNDDQMLASLMDQRQRLVDSISEVIPTRQVARDGNQIALFAPGGATLIDGPAAEFSFAPTAMIVPEMSVDNGLLNGLDLNGQPLPVNGGIEGGLLAAAFDTRDQIATDAQAGLDALARDLVERFQDPGLDATISPGGAGLFTDGGGAFVATDEPGLAGRIAINAAVDPAAGGAAWRLRDGIGASLPGAVGDSTLISALADRVAANRTAASGPSAGLSRSLSALASDVLSSADSQQRRQDEARAFHSARADALAQTIAENGVDTDDEMQKLLLIEQVYAANARVIQTIEVLMQQLIEI